MKILVYGNRKTENIYYDASTPEKEEAAYLALFKILDEEWEVYVELEAAHKTLYDAAKSGDAKAAKKLIYLRRHYEYEEVREAQVQDTAASAK
jgi:hypothetical protein